MAPTYVDGPGVEPQQDVDARPRPVAELIDLVGDLEGFAEMPGRGVRRVLDDDGGALVPWVTVEGATQELAVRRDRIPRVGRAVHADEPSTIANRLEYRLPNRGRDGQLSGREEQKGAMGAHGVRRDALHVRTGRDVSDLEAS